MAKVADNFLYQFECKGTTFLWNMQEKIQENIHNKREYIIAKFLHNYGVCK